MARAPYNQLMDAYYGPSWSAVPVLAVADIPCRLVIANHIFPSVIGNGEVIGYVTFPHGTGMLLPDYYQDGLISIIEWANGDVLEIPAGSGVFYAQVVVDYIVDVETENYRRVWVTEFDWEDF